MYVYINAMESILFTWTSTKLNQFLQYATKVKSKTGLYLINTYLYLQWH